MILDPPNYILAQHSFIKAVIADNQSAIAWTNLGTLYYILEDYKLANEAFSQAQRSDPNYVNSWIGQVQLYRYIYRFIIFILGTFGREFVTEGCYGFI